MMEFNEITLWIALACGAFLVLVYTGVLVHVWLGSKDKWVMKIAGLFLASNVFQVFNNYEAVLEQNKSHYTNLNWENLAVIVGVTVALRQCMSCTGYYLVAKKYQTIS